MNLRERRGKTHTALWNNKQDSFPSLVRSQGKVGDKRGLKETKGYIV